MTERYASPIGSIYRPPAVDMSPPAIAPTSLLHAPLILVVDDHEPSRALARLVLERAGFRVAEAATGREGLRQAQVLRPAVVLLDIILPEIDGWTVCRRLREDVRTRDSIILALTAWTGVGDGARALALGFEEVLTKPVLPRTLAAVVARYVAERPMAPQPAR
jgi:two-component system, cell cycle response regulator DivK